MVRINLDEGIEENGFGNIQLLDSFFKIRRNLMLNPKEWAIETRTWVPDFISYVFQDSIEFVVNVHLGYIVSIKFKGSYKGKFLGKVGVGDTIRKLKELISDLAFDEAILFPRDNMNIQFEINNDNQDINSLEEVADKIITGIVINDKEFSSVSFAATEMPSSWKKFLLKKNSSI